MRRPLLDHAATASVAASAAAACALLLAAAPAFADDVVASAPLATSVTIYRDPGRRQGPVVLSRLGGFALVSETRTVSLPAGLSRLRFEGVLDGLQADSVIVSGLPDGVVEKNRDAAVLSPEALVRAAVDKDVELVRLDRRSGKTLRTPARILSANKDGVLFATEDGVEALSCAGGPEGFVYSRAPDGLGATPTLTALARARRPIVATITLSYLSSGFDWAANYVARLAPDAQSMDIGAWITLANGNAVSLKDATLQIVAGRVRHTQRVHEAAPGAPRVLARCWPQGRTTDGADPRPQTPKPAQHRLEADMVMVTAKRGAFAPMAAAAPPPPPEDLGDLKLYRTPERTTLASLQSKQVRLLEKTGVRVARLQVADLDARGAQGDAPAMTVLRSMNKGAEGLGVPLPAGVVAVMSGGPEGPLLLGEAPLKDTAVDEDVELKIGPAPDVRVRQTRLSSQGTPSDLSADLVRDLKAGAVLEEVDITNAGAKDAPFELRLRLTRGYRVLSADQRLELKDARPIFRLTAPANGAVRVRYAVAK